MVQTYIILIKISYEYWQAYFAVVVEVVVVWCLNYLS